MKILCICEGGNSRSVNLKKHNFKLVRKATGSQKNLFCCATCGQLHAVYGKVTEKEANDYVFKYYSNCERWI